MKKLWLILLLVANVVVAENKIPTEPTPEQLQNRSIFEVKPVTFGDKVFHYAFKYGLDRNDVEDLLEIMRCESGIKPHAVGKNKDSMDWGWWQINDKTWDNYLKQKGFNIKKSEDNLEAGFYLFAKYGPNLWRASKHCHKIT